MCLKTFQRLATAIPFSLPLLSLLSTKAVFVFPSDVFHTVSFISALINYICFDNQSIIWYQDIMDNVMIICTTDVYLCISCRIIVKQAIENLCSESSQFDHCFRGHAPRILRLASWMFYFSHVHLLVHFHKAFCTCSGCRKVLCAQYSRCRASIPCSFNYFLHLTTIVPHINERSTINTIVKFQERIYLKWRSPFYHDKTRAA